MVSPWSSQAGLYELEFVRSVNAPRTFLTRYAKPQPRSESSPYDMDTSLYSSPSVIPSGKVSCLLAGQAIFSKQRSTFIYSIIWWNGLTRRHLREKDALAHRCCAPRDAYISAVDAIAPFRRKVALRGLGQDTPPHLSPPWFARKLLGIPTCQGRFLSLSLPSR